MRLFLVVLIALFFAAKAQASDAEVAFEEIKGLPMLMIFQASEELTPERLQEIALERIGQYDHALSSGDPALRAIAEKHNAEWGRILAVCGALIAEREEAQAALLAATPENDSAAQASVSGGI